MDIVSYYDKASGKIATVEGLGPEDMAGYDEKVKDKVEGASEAKDGKTTSKDGKTISKAAENWNEGSFDDADESLEYHYKKHGKEVGAESKEQYARKAEEFARIAKKGSTKKPVNGKVPGTTRYYKNGKYIDLAPLQMIVLYLMANNKGGCDGFSS